MTPAAGGDGSRFTAGAGDPDPAPAVSHSLRLSGEYTLVFSDLDGREFAVAPDLDTYPHEVMLAGHRLDPHTARLLADALTAMARVTRCPSSCGGR